MQYPALSTALLISANRFATTPQQRFGIDKIIGAGGGGGGGMAPAPVQGPMAYGASGPLTSETGGPSKALLIGGAVVAALVVGLVIIKKAKKRR